MSVIIKGMRKPPKCEWLDNERNLQRCKLLIDDDCALQDCDDSWTWEELYARCPLDELSEKHGDLIDRDALKKDYKMGNDCNDCETDWKSCQYDIVYSKMDFCGWLDDAPVVIEAEDE